ncbi:MAG: hypothetical protein ACFFCE_11660 [Promethearchaeota archaeon]
MRFITGLKNLSKKKLLLTIIIIFIISWILLLFGAILSNDTFTGFIFIFILVLAAFTFILLIFSLFFNLDERATFVVITSFILFLPIAFVFNNFIWTFFGFCFVANQIFTAFFAFKFCMDTSTTVDDYLYRKKGSRIFMRILEFVVFLVLTMLFVIFIIRQFKNSSNPDVQALGVVLERIYLILIVIDTILFVFGILRFIPTKKFPAYISLFYLLTFIYMFYLVISLSLKYSPDNAYNWLSFIIDLFIFLYLLGSIFERVEYIKESIKILGADTIALFVILMKLIVQIVDIILISGKPLNPDAEKFILGSIFVLLLCFALFTLLIGLYKIFAHKEGKKSKHS